MVNIKQTVIRIFTMLISFTNYFKPKFKAIFRFASLLTLETTVPVLIQYENFVAVTIGLIIHEILSSQFLYFLKSLLAGWL